MERKKRRTSLGGTRSPGDDVPEMREVARSESGLAVRALLPVLEGLRALGLDVRTLLRASRIDDALLRDPEARIPLGAMMTIWSDAAAARGDDAIGLHVAESAPFDSFDVHAYAVLSSSTLRDGYERSSRYQRLIHDATELTLSGGDPAVLRHALPGGRPVPRQPAEFLLALYVRIGRAVTGGDWSPVEVRFAHAAPTDAAELRRFFAAPIRFAAGENALLLPRAVLDARNPRSDPALVSILDRYASRLLADRPNPDTACGAVRAHLQDALSSGKVSAEATAGVLAVSARTLARRLALEGTTYGALLDQLRHERALALLVDGRTSIAEVAFLLGFAELSSFYRAFRRWTGLTPAAYRRTHSRGSGAKSQLP